MHRNVFFRDDAGPSAPYSSFDSIQPEDLWTYMEIQRKRRYETSRSRITATSPTAGCTAPKKFPGGAMDARYAHGKPANEPLTEIIQTKGSSDTHPALAQRRVREFELFPNMINVGQRARSGTVRAPGLVEHDPGRDARGATRTRWASCPARTATRLFQQRRVQFSRFPRRAGR